MSISAYDQLRALTAAAAAGAAIGVFSQMAGLMPGRTGLFRIIKLSALTAFSACLVILVCLRSGQGLRLSMLCAVGAGFCLCRAVLRPIVFDAIKFIKHFLHI